MIGSALPLLAEDYSLLAPPATLDTTGGRSYPASLQEMFLDPIFLGMNVWPIDQPASFDALLLQDQFLLSRLRLSLPAVEAYLEVEPNCSSRRIIHGSPAVDVLAPAMTYWC